jgi:hypothetical protein
MRGTVEEQMFGITEGRGLLIRRRDGPKCPHAGATVHGSPQMGIKYCNPTATGMLALPPLFHNLVRLVWMPSSKTLPIETAR